MHQLNSSHQTTSMYIKRGGAQQTNRFIHPRTLRRRPRNSPLVSSSKPRLRKPPSGQPKTGHADVGAAAQLDMHDWRDRRWWLFVLERYIFWLARGCQTGVGKMMMSKTEVIKLKIKMKTMSDDLLWHCSGMQEVAEWAVKGGDSPDVGVGAGVTAGYKTYTNSNYYYI